jgi:phosphatidylglycerol:prolipoprotein diacylglycerol transferase
VAYGGFLGGLAGSFFFLRKHKIPLLPWADVAVPSLASGLMITRIGCYLFGCDFGRPLSETAPGWLKKLGSFPHWPDGTLEHGEGSPAWHQHVVERGLARTADHSLPVHPTQIYESLVGLGLLVLLLVVRRKQKFRGEIFFLFAFAYGVCRFLLELLRDDNERGSLPPSLPEHILIPLCMAVFAVGFIIGFSKLIRSVPLRRVAQAASFLPALALYLKMKPESFGMSSTVELSTSQFVAVTTGFAACAAFALFYKAAVDHPETAMALSLPTLVPAGGASSFDDDDDDDDDDDREERRPARGRARATANAKVQPAEGDADAVAAVKAKAGTNGAKKTKLKAKTKAPSTSDGEANVEAAKDDEPAKMDEPAKSDSASIEDALATKEPEMKGDLAKKEAPGGDAPSESEKP